MNILAAKVDWMERWSMPPVLCVLVDRVPLADEYRYEEKDGMYVAQVAGVVRYFFYGGGRRDGACGGVVTMVDGTTRDCHGAWSSGPYGVLAAHGLQCLAVHLTDDATVYARCSSNAGSVALTVAAVRAALAKLPPDHHPVHLCALENNELVLSAASYVTMKPNEGALYQRAVCKPVEETT